MTFSKSASPFFCSWPDILSLSMKRLESIQIGSSHGSITNHRAKMAFIARTPELHGGGDTAIACRSSKVFWKRAFIPVSPPSG